MNAQAILAALFARADDPATAGKIAVQQVNGEALTFAQLRERVQHTSANLQARGFAPGDRALLLIRPSVNTMVIVLAVVACGGAVVIGDPAMGKATFEARMRFAAPKWVFAESIILLLQRFAPLRRLAKQRGIEIPEMAALGDVRVVNVGRIPGMAALNLRDLMRPVPLPDALPTMDDDADMMIVFTSGTTSEPKGVVHTQRSLVATLEAVAAHLQPQPDDVVYTPALHITLPTLMAGGSAVLPPKRGFDAARTLQHYEQYGVTKTFEVPSRVQAMVEYLRGQGERFPPLRTMLLGAAPVFQDFLAGLAAVIHPQTAVFSVYGMTEILPVCAVSLGDKLAFDSRAGDLVGEPLPGVQAQIIGGELVLSGPNLFACYLGGERVTQHATGDLAQMDEAGRVVLLGRKKDMIIRGKHNIYPALFEPTIRDIRGVADCCMIGVYDANIADEVIVLVIESERPHFDETALRRALLTGPHSIDQYAQPDDLLVMPLPRTGRSQKIDRAALRQIARERLGIQQAAPTLEQHE